MHPPVKIMLPKNKIQTQKLVLENETGKSNIEIFNMLNINSKIL